MKRISLFVLPLASLLMAAFAFSQDAETAAEVAKKLGHDEYAVRPDPSSGHSHQPHLAKATKPLRTKRLFEA